MKVYLDNAATTPLDREVFEAMKPFMLEDFGNPSSTHSHGRKTKAAIESCRKQIASLLKCTPGEIIFTSGGTEADNAILHSALDTYKLKCIISSPLEHHAVLHTVTHLSKTTGVPLHWVKHNEKGYVDMTYLEELLKNNTDALVSLMHANNEIGNLLDIDRVGELCRTYGAYFHSDTVQTIGHYPHDLKKTNIHALTAAAHKFHGPKGVGFMYIRQDKKLAPYVHGGGQERGFRGGTENVYGIVGLTKALEIAYRDMDDHKHYLSDLKKYLISNLKENFSGITFNGDSANLEQSLYTVLNVSFPPSENNEMLLFNLDLAGISVSGGSACSSGAALGSHVLNHLDPNSQRGAIRFSFSKYNTREEIDYVIGQLKKIWN